MSTGLIYDERFLEHDTGHGHPERSDRVRAIVQHLESTGHWARMQRLSFGPAEPAAIEAVHDRAYIERLTHACDHRVPFIDEPDSAICEDSAEIAYLAAGGVLAAVDAVMAGQVDNAFCAVRPPGHHAERCRSMGFCMFNNVAVAAEHLLGHHGIERVAIVDFDVHHGNGTQHSFETRRDVLFVSLHEDPQWLYPGSGLAEEIGKGEGEGLTLNIPLAPHSGDEESRAAFDEQVLPKLDEFEPQALLVSAGFDAAEADPLAHQRVTDEGFRFMAERLCDAARQHCEGRLIVTLEGGYDLNALACGVEMMVESMLGALLGGET